MSNMRRFGFAGVLADSNAFGADYPSMVLQMPHFVSPALDLAKNDQWFADEVGRRTELA